MVRSRLGAVPYRRLTINELVIALNCGFGAAVSGSEQSHSNGR